jgi:hypothetical protein
VKRSPDDSFKESRKNGLELIVMKSLMFRFVIHASARSRQMGLVAVVEEAPVVGFRY